MFKHAKSDYSLVGDSKSRPQDFNAPQTPLRIKLMAYCTVLLAIIVFSWLDAVFGMPFSLLGVN